MTVHGGLEYAIPWQRGASETAPTLVEAVTGFLATMSDVDTAAMSVLADEDGVLVVGRVQWSSEARLVERGLRRLLGPIPLRARIRYVYNDVDDHRWRGLGLFG